MKKENASIFLRIGLGFIFVYTSIAAFTNPNSWIGFVPDFVANFISKTSVLYAHDVINLSLGLWIWSGKKTFYASIAACIVLIVIILSNITAFELIFRDIGLFFAALALAILSKDKD